MERERERERAEVPEVLADAEDFKSDEALDAIGERAEAV